MAEWVSEWVTDQLTTSFLLETKIFPNDLQANRLFYTESV